MSIRYRLPPEDRREVILEAAEAVARENGGDLLAVRLMDVHRKCRIPTSLESIKYHFGTAPELRDALRARMK